MAQEFGALMEIGDPEDLEALVGTEQDDGYTKAFSFTRLVGGVTKTPLGGPADADEQPALVGVRAVRMSAKELAELERLEELEDRRLARKLAG